MSEGNGHRSNIYPISQEALDKLMLQMQGIYAQALREAMQNRMEDLVGKDKTVTDLVANIDNEAFRASVRDALLLLKIDSLLAGLQHAPLELLSEAEVQEVHAYLLDLHQRALKGHQDTEGPTE